MNIKELHNDDELEEAFPIMRQLRPQHDLLNYLDIVKDAKENDNYRLFALYDQGEIAAVIGFKPMITLYYGRFVWVCDLVTAEYKRSMGYGERLLSFVHKWASENEYEAVALSSGLHRSDAHRFYEDKMDYERVSFVFKKEI